MAKTKSNGAAKTSEADIEALWEQFQSCAPLLTDEQVGAIERTAASADLSGIPRRAILASARFGGSKLIEKAKDRDCAVAVAALVEAGEAWIDRQKSLIELAEAQTLRLRMSLMDRPDTDSLFVAAEALLNEAPEVSHG